MTVYDLIILGGGPTGLFGAFYAGMRGMNTMIIDSLHELGGQLVALYPEKHIYDVPGFPQVLAKDLARNLIEQALQYKPAVCLDERVLRMESRDGADGSTICITTEPGGEHYAKALLITVGIGAFAPRKLALPDAERLEGKGVLYAVREKEFLRGKRVLVVGGGDSAVDWALDLNGIAKEVTLIHRREQFRAHEESVEKLRQTPARIKVLYELQALHGTDHLERVTIKSNTTMEEETLDVDYVIFNLGFHSSLGGLRDWGMTIEHNHIAVNSKMETSLHGIFGAGDIVTYPGKLKLIVTGFGEAAVAVNAIKTYLDPKARFFPGHSTELAAPPGAEKKGGER